MEYLNHLYAVFFPAPALVASQLEPQQFARHYVSGSILRSEGKLIFGDIDLDFRHPYFNIDAGLKELIPHEDGSPKNTKYISTYRVLEHIDFSKILTLHISTPSGNCLSLEPAEHIYTPSLSKERIFIEVTPLRSIVLTDYNFPEFGDFITNPAMPKSVPAVLYTQLAFDPDEFLEEFKANPFMVPPLDGLHTSRLRDAIIELRNKPEKHVKGMGLDCNFNSISYRRIRHGFTFCRQGEAKYFPMPSSNEIERQNLKFWQEI